MILACQNISKAFGIKEILNNVSFHIEDKEKLAIVGINGSGKTTLLKIIMGEETPDEGQIVIGKDTTIGYLSQHQDISFDNTIYAEMLATKKHIIETEAQIRQLELDMKNALLDSEKSHNSNFTSIASDNQAELMKKVYNLTEENIKLKEDNKRQKNLINSLSKENGILRIQLDSTLRKNN